MLHWLCRTQGKKQLPPENRCFNSAAARPAPQNPTGTLHRLSTLKVMGASSDGLVLPKFCTVWSTSGQCAKLHVAQLLAFLLESTRHGFQSDKHIEQELQRQKRARFNNTLQGSLHLFARPLSSQQLCRIQSGKTNTTET